MRSFTKNGTTTVKQTAREKWRYVIKNWQLYVVFLLPGLLLTIIFKYLPMGGVLIAFEDYNVIKGVFGSPWVGLEYFRRFLSSPDFMSYLLNTLKLSVYGLLWGFPIPILLALLLNQIRRTGVRKKIQLLNLRAEFYLGHRALRYGPHVPFSGGAAEFSSRDQHQLDDDAGGVSDHLYCQRDLADGRLVFHHVYGGSGECQQGSGGSGDCGRRKHPAADLVCTASCH